MPKTGNIADAAVKPNVSPYKVEYTATELLQYYDPTEKSQEVQIPYNLLGGVNTDYGIVEFDGGAKRIDMSKASVGYHQVLGYAAFYAKISVPALTEYKIEFSYSAYINRVSTTTTVSTAGLGFFYFGNTADDPNARDHSSELSFVGYSSGNLTPAEYVVDYIGLTSKTSDTRTGKIPEIVFSNDSKSDADYFVFFGFYSYGSSGLSKVNTFTSYLEMSETLKVTAIDQPSVNSDTAEHDANGSKFNFTYDQDRIKLSSVIFKNISGVSTDITGQVSISPSGECILNDVGTYSFKFDIADYCGAVWNTATNDQSTKTVEVKITPETVDIPYIDNNSQKYKGEAWNFTLLDFDSDLVNVEKVVAGNPTANSATAAGGGAIGATTSIFEAVNADTYTVTLKLADADNYVWNDEDGGNGTRTLQFTITPQELTLTYESSHTNTLGNAEWKADAEDVTIKVSDDRFENDDLSLIFYYDAKGHSLGTSDGKSTELNMTGIESGAHTLYVDFAVKTGVNANYTISNGSYPFNVKAASAQTDFKWVYYEGDTQKGYIEEGGTITYKKDTTYKVALVIPTDAKIEEQGYEAQSGSAVKSYETKVTIKSTDPENLFYDEDGNSSDTTTLTLNWSIVQAEVDVENVKFEYDDGVNGSKPYDPDNPPEYTEQNFKISVPEANYPDGVTNIEVFYDGDRKGPGTISFSLEFTLDSNYKSSTGETSVQYSMNITGKKVSVGWTLTELKDENGNEVKDENGVTYQVYVLDLDKSDPLYSYINYEYYEKSGSTYGAIIDGGIMHVVTPTTNGGLGAGYDGHTETIYVHAYIGTDSEGNSAPSLNGVPYYVLDFGVQPEYKLMTVGENKDPVDLSVGEITFITYGEKVETLGDLYNVIKRLDEQPLRTEFYTVALYKGTTLINKDINEVDFTKLDAGTDYKLLFALTETAAESYALTSSSLNFTVKPVELIVPTLKDGATFTFNGDTQGIASSLDNWNGEYMEFASNSYHEARNAGSYTVIINIKEDYAGNYIFVLPESTANPVKAAVRYALVDEELPELSNNSSTASFKWTIEKYVIDTTSSSAWNFSATGASLNLPNWLKALTAGAEPTLNIQVVYYDTEGNPLTEYELKGGNSFLVAAYIDPTCADFGNIEFKNQAVDPMTSLTTSPQTAYTVPLSGAAAFIGNVKDFVTKTWLGLPIWAWLAIGLAVLILLIIIIAVACKRRKTKEQREEIKARKEEEKARREEERRMQQEKLEAERELAKAKQEAELEKIRMQAGMAGMAGAGMASMAMPQQGSPVPQVQQPMAQPVQAQLPVQQSYDGGAMARIEAELAEIRARQNVGAGYAQAPVQQTLPQYMSDPVAAAELIRLKAENEAHLRAELERSRSETERARAEAEIAKARAENSRYAPYMPQFDHIQFGAGGDIEKIGALAVAIWRSMNTAQPPVELKPAEVQQIAEESGVQGVHTVYPPDSVVTTTTTVDTTKGKPAKSTRDLRNSREEDRNFDIDGFYDKFE